MKCSTCTYYREAELEHRGESDWEVLDLVALPRKTQQLLLEVVACNKCDGNLVTNALRNA